MLDVLPVRTNLQPICRETPGDGLTGLSLQPLAAGVAIALYAAWNARNLAGAWLHSPFDRCGSPAFLLWIVPIAWVRLKRPPACPPMPVSAAAFAIGLAVSFAGVATDLGVLKYAGLAIALAGFLPIRAATFLWLGCAAAWMPAAGWAFSSHGVILVNSMRAGIGLMAALSSPLFLRHE